jgi:hypothetical protein
MLTPHGSAVSGSAGWGGRAKNEDIEIDSIVPRLTLRTRLPPDLVAGR